MKIDVYQSAKKSDCFLSVPTGTDPCAIKVSANEGKVYGEVRSFQKSLSIDTTDNRAAIDSSDVIDQINEKGYAIQGAIVQFEGV